MRIKYFGFLYLIVIIGVIAQCTSLSFSYNGEPREIIVQYITNLSTNIYNSIQLPYNNIYSSKGELKIKLFLAPSGELRDAYISKSSGNKELDERCLNAALGHKKYEPFPEELGVEDLWIDVPIIFDSIETSQNSVLPSLYKEEGKAGSNIAIGLNEAVDIASENYIPAKIAIEEISLARLKIREATRALYPTTSLNYLETTGKTTGTSQDFTDKEYKVKFEYPLYYGWRLKYAVDQAASNMKASTLNYDKTLQDLRVEVEVAFYSYITNKMNVYLHKSLLEDTWHIFDIAKKRFDAELSTKAEFLQVESQFKQINYQVISSENELALSRLTLAQAMNIEEKDNELDLIGDIDAQKPLEPIDLGITLKECMDMALAGRPDIKAKEYMIEFNDYERKINESKNQLKVDLTGSYGESGGAYETESLTMGKDWYLGFKVSKPLGGNTLSTSYTQDKTSQKHGQSTRTESFSKSVELGLLDNIQRYSEAKSADISLEKARNELQQAKDSVAKEVKEAYLSYKKGLEQVKTNLNKIQYREEELKIAKTRAELNEISLSDLVQAYMSLIDEKSYYIEAIGSLYQSLAKLNKATGYALFLDDEDFKLANLM